MWCDSLCHHSRVGHEHKRVGIAGHPRQFRKVRTSHHEQPIFLLCQGTDGKRAVPVERPHQHIDPVFLDELRRNVHGSFRIRCIICFENDDRAAQHTAFLVEQIHGHIGAMDIMN